MTLSGSSTLGRRTASSSVRGSVPTRSRISIGAGRKSSTASRTKRTPLCFSAEPASTGVASRLRVARRSARITMSSGISASSTNRSRSSSSFSAATSSMSWRCIAASSRSSSGISLSRYSRPSPSSGNVTIFMRTRSMKPAKSFSAPTGIWIGTGRASRTVLDRLDGLVEVGPDPVHLVNEADARDAVAVGLAPDGLGLGLDAAHRIEHRDRAVEHAQRALDLRREVDVARRVDDVDREAVPIARRGRGLDRDPALLLLLEVVHRGRAIVDLPGPVDLLREEQDPLGDGRLPGVDVRHDPDVALVLGTLLLDAPPCGATRL